MTVNLNGLRAIVETLKILQISSLSLVSPEATESYTASKRRVFVLNSLVDPVLLETS